MKFKRRSTSPAGQDGTPRVPRLSSSDYRVLRSDNTRASKVAIGIIRPEGADPEMTRLFTDEGDIRKDPEVGAQILELLSAAGVKSVIVKPEIFGCPHEEGIDYPDGAVCPHCPFWAGRDRDTGEMIQ